MAKLPTEIKVKVTETEPFKELLFMLESSADELPELIKSEYEKYTDKNDLTERQRMMKIIKAVAHIGVDFGYGNYELEPEFIDMARAIIEQN